MASVLFVCHQNAGRSQMSEALFSRTASGRLEARSAGTRPAARLHPNVVGAMREVGIDLSSRQPRRLTCDLTEWADVIVTMGCGDECPYVPGKKFIDWNLTDPADKTSAEVRAIRDEIAARVNDLVAQLDARALAS